LSNILVVTAGLAVGGAEKLAVGLVNEWKNRQFNTYFLSLSDPNPLADSLLSGACTFIAYPRLKRIDWDVIMKIRRLILEKKIRSVLAFDVYAFFMSRLATLGLKTLPRLILSIHSTKPFSRIRFIKDWIMARSIRDKDLIVSVCEAQADFWSKAYSIPRNKFVNIYNGVDIVYFDPTINTEAGRKIRDLYHIAPDDFVIVQVASLKLHKRHDTSFHALKHIQEFINNRKCYLLLVGGGDSAYEAELKNLAISLGISAQVHFCGIQDEVRPYYQAADLFTLSSSAIETFSIAGLEAMSMGLPCVLTKVGGAKEMVSNDALGYLVDADKPVELAAAWSKVLINLQHFDRLKIRRHVISSFDIKKCAQAYANILIKEA